MRLQLQPRRHTTLEHPRRELCRRQGAKHRREEYRPHPRREIVAPDEPLQSLPVARAVWKPAPSLTTSAESWLVAGGPHHTALTTAVGSEALEDFAVMTDIELVHITADTTSAQFIRELRWNQAYYRLGHGLAH